MDKYLVAQFRIAQHKQFGKSTEGHPGQGMLFNEAEELIVETEIAEEAISCTRKKPDVQGRLISLAETS